MFQATVKQALRCRCERSTIATKIAKYLDRCYARNLRTAFNVKVHHVNLSSNADLYGCLPAFTH